MHSLEYHGKQYRSLKELCSILKLSYSKVRRLTRHYRRAHNDPVIAIKWATGEEVRPYNEPKTLQYQQDLEKGYDRQQAFKERVINTLNTF